MRLYHWKCEGYGEEATVAAASYEDAAAALLREKRPSGPCPPDPDPGGGDRTLEWVDWHMAQSHNDMIDRMLARDGYRLRVYVPGEVLWTEVS